MSLPPVYQMFYKMNSGEREINYTVDTEEFQGYGLQYSSLSP